MEIPFSLHPTSFFTLNLNGTLYLLSYGSPHFPFCLIVTYLYDYLPFIKDLLDAQYCDNPLNTLSHLTPYTSPTKQVLYISF